jgi:hypothetical protein
MTDLVERLQKTLPALRSSALPKVFAMPPAYRNPDGPEAAARITELEAEVARLREALERCSKIVKNNLYRQHEKIEDVPIIVERALRASQEQSNG